MRERIAICIVSCALVTSCFAQHAEQSKSDTANKLKSFLRTYLNDPDKDPTTRFSFAQVDLNDDSSAEIIVYLTGDSWCGSGGCPMLVLAREGESSYKVVTRTTITRLPIRVLATKSHRWHDIGVKVQGGGIIHAYEARLRFDGHTYPSNPAVLPAQQLKKKIDGKVVLSLNDEGVLLYN